MTDRPNKLLVPDLKLDILPPAQRHLWERMFSIPPSFTLYGGTAIALQLGHRQSIDFDFFAFEEISPENLLHSVYILQDCEVLHSAPSTLTVLVNRAGPVKLSFFGLPKLRRLQPPLHSEEWPVRIATLLDLAGMKLATIPRRVEAKDYLDMHAILTRTDISLEQGLAAARIIYHDRINPLDTLKALTWFDDERLAQLPEEVREDLKKAVTDFDHDSMEYHQMLLEAALEVFLDDDDVPF